MCRSHAVYLGYVYLACIGLTAANANSVVIANLTIDGLTSPIGTTSLTPAFSWQFATLSQRNVTQIAYELVISSNQDTTGDIWDSGKVQSSKSTVVVYAGPALLPAQVYWIAVRAWTSNASDPTAYTSPLRFATGLQSAADWDLSSEFIGFAPGNNAACPWLRTTFELSSQQVSKCSMMGPLVPLIQFPLLT
jgi:alpha-L-rhamnosidase